MENKEEKLLILGDFFYSYDYIAEDIEKIAKYIKENNYKVILNLEGPLKKGNNKIKKRGPNLCQNEMVIKVLKKMNVVGVTLANNHIMDYNEEALKYTIDLLDKNNIKYCGAGRNIDEALKPMIIHLNNKNIYVFNYGWNIEETVYAKKNKAGAAPLEEKIILKQFEKIEENNDNIIINLLHWGFEYNIYPMPKDIYLAHKMIDNGSDFVIGHHPHNIQSHEFYKEKQIYYSLGNFYFSSRREKYKTKKFKYEIENMCDYGLGLIIDLNLKKIDKEIIFCYDQKNKETIIIENIELKEKLTKNISNINVKTKNYENIIKTTSININPILKTNKLINKVKIILLFLKYRYYKIKKQNIRLEKKMNQTQRTKNSTRNMISGVLNKFILMFFPFAIRTILIKQLGSEYLGLNNLFVSILQVLNIAELGFGNAIIFNLYKPIALNQKDKICALMNLYKKIYRIIGIIILIVGLLLLPFLNNLIKGTYPQDINIYLLYLLYLLNTVLTYFLFAYKSAIITAHQRNDIITNINTVLYVLQYIVQIIVLYITKNYYIYIIVSTITIIVNNIYCAIIANKKYPEYQSKGEIDKETKKEIKKNVVGLMIQKICSTTRNSLDSIFISSFLGLNIVAIYGNYYSVMTIIVSILNIIISSITTSVGNSIAIESKEKNYIDMRKFNFIYMWISGICTVCLLILYQPFMEIWMGKEYMFDFSIVICFCIYFYSLQMGNIRSVYTTSAGLWYQGKYRSILETIANIILNIILGKIFGIHGIILGTCISLIIFNFIYGSNIVFNYYFKNNKILQFFKEHFIYMVMTIISCIVAYYLTLFINIGGIFSLLIKLIVSIIVPNVLYYFTYKNMEIYKISYTFIKGLFLKIIKRKS